MTGVCYCPCSIPFSRTRVNLSSSLFTFSCSLIFSKGTSKMVTQFTACLPTNFVICLHHHCILLTAGKNDQFHTGKESQQSRMVFFCVVLQFQCRNFHLLHQCKIHIHTGSVEKHHMWLNISVMVRN